MTERESYETIYGRWEDKWDELHPQDPNDPDYIWYTFDNEIGDSQAKWARVSINPGTSEQATQGSAPSRKFLRRGTVIVQLFAPIDQGRGVLADMIADVRTVLEGQRLGELNLHAASSSSVPTDGAWAMAVVTVPFWYEETR